MEHLLGRLEVEQSSPVIRRIVKLLMNSFHPANKESNELVRMNLVISFFRWQRRNNKVENDIYTYRHSPGSNCNLHHGVVFYNYIFHRFFIIF
jgi:hypothetical protein